MSNLQNNLFNYATKELSQDAFICWLCSFALNGADNTDKELVRCAKELIREFMKRGISEEIGENDVTLKDVRKQYKNIDVLLTVEYKGEIYEIIVEDKINSSEHDNQLEKYKKQLECDKTHIIGIYFKTGFQSNLSEVDNAGYKLFGRKDILGILDNCGTDNAILKDYRAYWKNFEELTQCFMDHSIDKWPDWQTVNGFYDHMQSELEDKGFWAGYDYVSNRAGGFWGLWYGDSNCDSFEMDELKAGLYLQIESKWNDEKDQYDIKICLKLENKTFEDKRIWDLRKIIIDNQASYHFEKPYRLGSGLHMTIGVYTVLYHDSTELKKAVFASLEDYYNLAKLAYKKMKEITDNRGK